MEKTKKFEVFSNSENRLFRVDGNEPELLNGVDIWRIMWRGGEQRVILRGFTDGYKWIQNFPEECVLELARFIPYELIENYSDGEPLYRFSDCRISRMWVPHATASTFDEAQRLDIWIDIVCIYYDKNMVD